MSIQVKKLNHVYAKGLPHESIAIKDVSFTIEDEEFVGIIGHTGSGKSTLVQHINGLLKPTSGSILIDGTDITNSKDGWINVRKNIGLVFQYPEYQLFEDTIYKDIAFGPKNLGLSDDEVDLRVREAMKLVKLDFDEFAERSPFDLSGGQKRRVAIAGVIAMKPSVLIMDEPTAGLDPQSHIDILKMIHDIHKTEKNICIFISHNMNDVARLSDKIIVMNSGCLVDFGTPSEVFSNYENLKKIGLDLPDNTSLAADLISKGFHVDYYGFEIEDAENMILNLLKKEV